MMSNEISLIIIITYCTLYEYGVLEHISCPFALALVSVQ